MTELRLGKGQQTWAPELLEAEIAGRAAGKVWRRVADSGLGAQHLMIVGVSLHSGGVQSDCSG